ncbi:hypothetical protein FRB93_009013 [Tulasnella sp. JGI-2019a]|nr:hypothetical protein FRB93_009013 [Tulasnella sp. JGI-2019a]
MSIEKTSAHQFPQQLKLSSSNSHLISIPPPVKPVHYGNCDLFKGIYQDASIRVVLASKCPRVIGEVAQLEIVQRCEIPIWSQLNHINLLPFYSVELISQSSQVSEAYMASPWVENGDLFEFLAACLKYFQSSLTLENTMPERMCEAFMTFDEPLMILRFASGLAYLYTNSIIHGNLKAVDILLETSFSL